ncbi:LysM peptidoglycan-binding domain-containing protein [Ramlibacter sp.]|uniref:LysM peptidoglycan-binding domain-containing protein n=1 Tax=Ramlibacter sp. TaxID=1917967 RepID=UPI003D146CDE
MFSPVSGNGLGLLNTSLFTLGTDAPSAPGADARAGRGADRVYVNAATGNLVVQATDELLTTRGEDLRLARTYNSQGLLDDDNGDNWLPGAGRRVHSLTGTLNRTGSTVSRTDADGSRSLFTYDWARGEYRSTNGAGAVDVLREQSGVWRLTEGESTTVQEYDRASGRLLRTIDTFGNVTTFTYASATGQLTTILGPGGETLLLDYASGRLSQVRWRAPASSGATATTTAVGTRYTYDTAGRLSQVTVDLTPADGAITDGNTYWTRYTYEGSSRRIATLAQKDGSALAFTYVQSGSLHKVASVTDAEGRVTRYAYDATARTTAATDPLGNVTTYAYDAAGQLLRVTAPAVGAAPPQVTRYAYNATGDLVGRTDPMGRTVTMAYDANGNRTEERDALGNTVRRVFNAAHRMTVEALYAVADPDGAGPALPGGALVTRNVYDGSQRLVYSVDPEGRVTRHEYTAAGQVSATLRFTGRLYPIAGLAANAPLSEPQLAAWYAASDLTALTRTDYAYDALGQLRTATTYANVGSNGLGLADSAKSVVSFIWSARGELLKTIDANGKATIHVYDGLGRVIGSTDGQGVTTATSYDDAGRRTTVKLASGLWTTTQYNAAGEAVSVSDTAAAGAVLGTTRNVYDALGRLVLQTQPGGRRTLHLYDAAGRRTASVDEAGAFVAYRYDAADRPTRTIAHATAVNPQALAAAFASPKTARLGDLVPASHSADRTSWTVYDSAGRAVRQIDGEGQVVDTQYDGASRIVRVTAYATRMDPATITDTTAGNAIASTSADRATRHFHDGAGLLLGTLDAAGYLTRYTYDFAGRRTASRAYVTATPPAARAQGTLAQLTPEANALQDLVTTWLYDRKDRMVGVVDAEGYLTEHVYDLAGNLSEKIRYATRANAGATLAASRPSAQAGDQRWRFTYTARGELATETAPDGTVTRHMYDSVGQLVETTRAWQTKDSRTATRRWDLQGRLVAELAGTGSSLLALAATPAAVEAVWASHALRHAYDADGRRISTTDANGLRTVYFHDAQGLLAAQVNAAGEVQAYEYDTFGNLARTVLHANRISLPPVASQGGSFELVRAPLAALADAGRDSITTYARDRDGRVLRETDALGNISEFTYDAFDAVVRTREQIDATRFTVREDHFNARGQRIATTTDAGGLNLAQTGRYDAFGRLESWTDASGATTTRSWDRLGREVQVQAPIGGSSVTYDAFDRVLVATDATGRQTRTTYDAAARIVTTVAPDGATVRATANRHGETISVTDAKGGVTAWTYDLDGRLASVRDATGGTESYKRDRAGRVVESKDANGVITTYSFDAADRIVTRTVGGGLNQVTRYGWDTAGRTIETIDAQGTKTTTTYDAGGNALTVTLDPEGLALVTRMAYDAQGRTLAVTDASGRETTYAYDGAGRRTSESTGGLVTRWFHDVASNVVARQDADGSVTRWVYDANHRQVYVVDAAGGVRGTRYDDAGRIVEEKTHTLAVSKAWLATLAPSRVLQASEVEQQLQIAQQGASAAGDARTERIFDANGRLGFTIDAAGALTRFEYDRNGNLVRRTGYANPVNALVPRTWAALVAALPAANARNRVLHNAYDAANRLVRQLDAGQLTVMRYDAAGQVIERVSYATLTANVNSTPASTPSDRIERMAYDAAGRVVARATAQRAGSAGETLHSVEQFTYDATGRVTAQRRLANFLFSAGAPAFVAQWLSTATRDDARDSVQRFAYDAAGRLVRETDAEGAVRDSIYDDAGRLIAQVAYAGSATGASTAPATPATLATLASALDAGSRLTRFAYDASGRLALEVDAEGAATRYVRDGAGRILKTIRYANIVALAPAPAPAQAWSEATIAAALRPDAAHDRVEQNVYDAAGRIVYTIDAEGAVRGHDYDAAGNVRAITRFGVFLAVGNASTSPDVWSVQTLEFALSEALAGRDDLVRTDVFDYDARGLLLASTDSLGFEERFSYDALGNKLSFTNKRGATWNYTYDAAGRLLKETTPEVAVAANGTATEKARRIDTVLAYDALGNVVSRTEAANIAGQSRTTTYVYDAVGRQIKTIHPQVWVHDGSTPTAGDLLRHEILVAPTTGVVYDALGNAIAGRDVAGNDSLRRYDRAGRLVAETDALGGVTEYTLNAFGEVERLTRRARLAGEQDRSIETRYDRRGRSVEVLQPLAFAHDTRAANDDGAMRQATWTSYDAFGEATKVTQGGVDADGAAFASGATRYWHDRRGALVGELRALDGHDGAVEGGYFTATVHDAEGRVVESTAYDRLVAGSDAELADLATVRARLQAGSGDRTTRSAYDDAGRLRSETRVGRYSGTADGEQLQTLYYRDALGNVTATRDATGAITRTVFDALGRERATLGATRTDVDGTNETTPLTQYARDVYGNVVARTESSRSAVLVGDAATWSYTAPAFDAARDRRTLTEYDAHGHAIRETDALGVVTQRSYDSTGRLARTWTPVATAGEAALQAAFTVQRYDALGRLSETVTPLDAGTNTVTQYHYDNFGELTRTTVNGQDVETNEFDAAGRLWRTRGADGVVRVFVRDVQGRVTQEITNPLASLANVTLATIATAADQAGARVTETRFDSLGHAVATLAARETESLDATTQQVAWLEIGPASSVDGVNAVELSWSSFADLGAGDVKVRIDYVVAGTDEPQSASRTQIFEASQATEGAGVEWLVGPEFPAIAEVARVQVWKKTTGGDWRLLIDRGTSGAWGAWITADAPREGSQGAQLWMRPEGSSSDYVLQGDMVRFGDRVFHAHTPGEGQATRYDYQVRWGEQVRDAGTFSLASRTAALAESDRPAVVGDALVWKAGEEGTYERLRFRAQGGEWIDVVDQRVDLNSGWIARDGANARLDIALLPLGDYAYELLRYGGTADAALVAHANGSVSIGPVVTFGTGTDAAGTAHVNVLSWPAPPQGETARVEMRTADHSVEPAVVGAWQDFSANAGTFGATLGLPLDERGSGPVQYRVSYIRADGSAYARSTGTVYIVPAPAVQAVAGGLALAWAAPASMVLGGVTYEVQQTLRMRDVATGIETDFSYGVASLGEGMTGIDFAQLGLQDGLAHAHDYTLTWRIPGLADTVLGSASGRFRIAGAPPLLVAAIATQDAHLAWTIPLDLTGERMAATLKVRASDASEWTTQAFESKPDGAARFELPAGTNEYLIEYAGREVAGGAPVAWGSHGGVATALPQPRFGVFADANPLRQAELERVLSWPAAHNEAPQGASVTLVERRTGAASQPAIGYGYGGRNWIDFNGYTPGDHDYTLVFTAPGGGELGRVTGVVRVVPEPELRSAAGATAVWSAPQIAWPGIDVRQRFEVSPRTHNAWSERAAVHDAVASEYAVDLSSLDPSAWDYRLIFTDGATGQEIGRASGTFVSFPPPGVGPVAGQDLPAAALSWMTPPAGLRAEVKLTRVGTGAGAVPVDFDALPAYTGPFANWGAREGVLLSAFAAGDYAYRVEYFETASGVSFGRLHGSLRTAPPAVVTNVPAGATYAQPTAVLHWPTAADVSVQIELRDAQGAIVATPAVKAFTFDGPRAGIELDALATGSYSYVLTFTIDGEQVQSTGAFDYAAAGASSLGVGVFGANLVSWPTPPEGVSQRLLLRAVGETEWIEPLDPEDIPPVGDEVHSGFTLDALGTGDYDIRVEFTLDDEPWGEIEAVVHAVGKPSFGVDVESASMFTWGMPLAGVTSQLEIWRNGVPVSVPSPSELEPGRIGISLADRTAYPAGAYTWRLSYTNGIEPAGETTGSFHIAGAPTVAFDAPSITQGTTGRYLAWSTPPAGWTQHVVIENLDNWEFEPIEVSGAQVPSLGNGLSGWDIAGLSQGRYRYAVTLAEPGGAPNVSTGEFTVAPEVYIDSDWGYAFWEGASGGEWPQVYENDEPLPDESTYVDLASRAPGIYSFRAVYSDDAGAYTRVDTTLEVSETLWPPGSEQNMRVLGVALSIAESVGTDGNPRTFITFEADEAATYRFIWGGENEGEELDVVVEDGIATIDVSDVNRGNHSYELIAVKDGVYAHATGEFFVSHAAQAFTVPVKAIEGVHVVGTQLRWPAVDMPDWYNQRVEVLVGGTWTPLQYPQYERGELYAEFGDLEPGSYHVSIYYVDRHPSRATVMTHNARGVVTVGEETVLLEEPELRWIETHEVLAEGHNPIPDVQLHNPVYTDEDGTGQHVVITVPYPDGFAREFNGQEHAWARSELKIDGVTYSGTPYIEDTLGLGFSGVQAFVIDSIPGRTFASTYELKFFAADGTVFAAQSGLYEQWAVEGMPYEGSTGAITDTTPAYVPYRVVEGHEEWVESELVTVVSYETNAPLQTYSFVAPGSLEDPRIEDYTEAPLEEGRLLRGYEVASTQRYYYFRGVEASYLNGASTAVGSALVSGGADGGSGAGGGGSATLSQAHGTSLGLGVTQAVALSHQSVTEGITSSGSGVTLSSLSRNVELTGLVRQDRLFGASNHSAVDQTVADGLPVSLAFDPSWVESAITSAPSVIATTPTVRSEFDRWGNAVSVTDARNADWRTTYTYNASNQMTSAARPNEGGAASITRASYDNAGRTLSVTDANGNATQMAYDAAGNLVGERRADGAVTLHKYDVLGNRTQMWVHSSGSAATGDIRYRVTNYGYDLKGQLTEVVRPNAETRVTGLGKSEEVAQTRVTNWQTAGFDEVTHEVTAGTASGTGRTLERYAYDSLGRRTSALLTTQDGQLLDATGINARIATTKYDLAGHVIEQSGFDAQVTKYRYDAFGRKVYEQDARGGEMTWTYQGASHVVADHVGLDGTVAHYAYDDAGQLVHESSGPRVIDAAGNTASVDRVYTYDVQGRVTGIVDRSQPGVEKRTEWTYDEAGNRTREVTKEVTEQGTRTLQDNVLTHDAQGRLTSVQDSRMSLAYAYDAAGNRVRTQSRYYDEADTLQESDIAMAYDAMNRVTLQRDLKGGTAAAVRGKSITYDVMSRQATQSWLGAKLETYSTPFDPETGTGGTSGLRIVEGETTERYVYDAAGHLGAIYRDNRVVESRRYDAAGRMVTRDGTVAGDLATQVGEQGIAELGLDVSRQNNVYDGGSDRIKAQYVEDFHVIGDGESPQRELATSARTRFEYDAVGNATKITTDAYRSEERSGDAILTYQAIGDAYREVKQEKLGGVAMRSYDANGFITGVTQQIHGASPTRRISTDAMGHVLENRELNTGITERFLIAEGQQLAKTGREATYRDVAGVTTQFANVLRPTAQGSSAGSYVVQAGDTLQTIARTVYGDASFWFVLAEANGLSDPDDVEAGQALIVPSTASFGGGTLNGANTVQPYDIMQALGENTPNLPMPADGPACGGMGQIVMVIVAVIVTVYTAGALTGASGFLQTMQAGLSVMTSGVAAGTTSVAATLGTAGTLAVSSAVGSIASQVVGVATGVQEKFSLEQIAMSAISGGVSGGLVGANFGLGDIGNFAARAAVTSTVTQGIAVATGMQDHFSWRSVSASAIGAGIGAAVAPVLGKVYGDSTFGQFGARFTTGLVAGAAAAAARGGRVSSQQVAIDAFGNALGSSLADSMGGAGATQQAQGESGDVLGDLIAKNNNWANVDVGPVPTLMNGLSFSEDVGARNRARDPLGVMTAYRDSVSVTQRAGLLWGTNPVAPSTNLLSDSSSNAAIAALYMSELGYEGDMVPAGGGSVRVTPGMVNGISVNRRAEAAFQLADDLAGMTSLYRDYKLLGGVMSDLQQTTVLDKLKGALQDKMGMMRVVPTPDALGATMGIGLDGVVRYNNADLIDRYSDALRKVQMWKQGIVELDTRSMLITSIGNQRMSPMQWVDENTQRYQKAFAAGVEEGQRRVGSGQLRYPVEMPQQLQVGLFADSFSRDVIVRYNERLGVPEGPGQLLVMNRWAYDPNGSGMTVRPDMLLDLGPNRANQVLRFVVDGKSSMNEAMYSGAQFGRTSNWLGGASVKAATPQGLLPWIPRKGR